MAENTLAALVAYDALGLPLDRAQAGADAITLSRWRGEELPLHGGGIVVNDAYNANPVSMRAALLDLVVRAGDRRRVVILGEMAELGAESERYHDEIGLLVDELGIELVDRRRRGARPYIEARGRRSQALDSRRCRLRPASPASSSRATRFSSRRRVRSGSKASRPRSRNGQGHGPSPDRRPRRDGHRHRDRPYLHRVAAANGCRPADPRGRACAPHRQARDADDGWPADPGDRDRAVPRALAVHDSRAWRFSA